MMVRRKRVYEQRAKGTYIDDGWPLRCGSGSGFTCVIAHLRVGATSYKWASHSALIALEGTGKLVGSLNKRCQDTVEGTTTGFVTSECLSQDANANSSGQVRFPTYTASITQDEDPDSYSRFSIYGVFNEEEASSSQWPAHCTCVYLDVLYEHWPFDVARLGAHSAAGKQSLSRRRQEKPGTLALPDITVSMEVQMTFGKVGL